MSFKSNHYFQKGMNILSYSGSPSPSPGVRSSVAGSLKHLRLDIKYVDYFWLGYVTFESLCQNTHYGSQTIRTLTSAECTWACILWLTLLEAFWLPLVFSFSSYHQVFNININKIDKSYLSKQILGYIETFSVDSADEFLLSSPLAPSVTVLLSVLVSQCKLGNNDHFHKFL